MSVLLQDAVQTRDTSHEGMQAAQLRDAFDYRGTQAIDNAPDWARTGGYAERDILDINAAGDALFQEIIDTVIRFCHKRMIQAVAVFDYREGSGDAWHLNRATPGPNGIWVDDNVYLTCDADLTDPNFGTSDYVKVSFPYKSMLLGGSVSRQVQGRGRGYVDVFAEELTHVVHRAMFTLELAIFQGNFAGSAPLEFDGLLEMIGVYNGSLAGQPTQVLIPDNATSDPTPASSASGTLDTNLLDKAEHQLKPGGMRRAWFVSRTGQRLINQLLVAQRQYGLGAGQTSITIAGGFQVTTYNNHPIVMTDGIPDEMAWGEDGSGNPILTALSGATGTARTTAVIIVDLDEVFIAERTPLTVEPLAQCTTQRRKFEAYGDWSLVYSCPEAGAMIIGVLPNA